MESPQLLNGELSGSTRICYGFTKHIPANPETVIGSLEHIPKAVGFFIQKFCWESGRFPFAFELERTTPYSLKTGKHIDKIIALTTGSTLA